MTIDPRVPPPTAAVCRTCGSADARLLGALPDVAVFAGRPLRQPLPGGWLHACRHCGFVFRAPVLDDAAYLALYEQGATDVWEQHIDRPDFDLVRAQVAAAAGTSATDVLDIGCYTGALLATLPAACRRHGVEPNPEAARMAAAQGVAIVAAHWHELATQDRRYDIITACDVIEHVGNPLHFMSTLAGLLNPGGLLIITTGNPQSWPWRLTGARFWYCHFPEHISFIGPRWLSHHMAGIGLRVQRLERFAHSALPGAPGRVLALAKTLVRLAMPARQAAMLGSGIAPDHLMCVLQRP